MNEEQEYRFVVDAWRFWRRYREARADDEYWDELLRAANELVEKSGNSELVRELVTLMLRELERRILN